MPGIRYFKAEPTEYVRFSAGGTTKKEGRGASGFFLPFRTNIEMVNIAAFDQPFSFPEVTSDKQEVNLQGGFVYSVTDPGIVLAKYNFSIDPKTKTYVADGPEQLSQQLVETVRTGARKIVQSTKLEQLLVMSDQLSEQIGGTLQGEQTQSIGVTVDMLYFSAIIPKPEIARALEAEYREILLERADKAEYVRRAQNVEQERAIQQNEMKTKIEMATKRAELVKLEGENKLKEADYSAQAKQKEMAVYEGLSADVLVAHGFFELGKNAARIDNLTITPELMAGIMNATRRD